MGNVGAREWVGLPLLLVFQACRSKCKMQWGSSSAPSSGPMLRSKARWRGEAAPCAQQDAVFRCICVAGNCTLHLGAGATASSSSLEVQSPMVAAEASYSPMPAVDAQQQQQDMVQQYRPKFLAPAGPLSSMDPAGVGPPPPSPVAADSLQQLFGRQQR